VLRVAAIGEVECAANLRSADRVQSSVTQGHRMPCAMSSVCTAGSVDAQPGVAACARHCGGRGWAGSRPKVASRARAVLRIHSPQQFVVVAFSRWCEATDAAVERINPLQRG